MKPIYESQKSYDEDNSVHIAAGLFLCSLLACSFPISERLKPVLFSCQVIPFVFIAGYHYQAKPSGHAARRKMLSDHVLPYALFAAAYITLSLKNAAALSKSVLPLLLGLSSSKNLFADIEPVGSVWMILMLLCVHILYSFTYRRTKDLRQLTVLVFLLSVAGLVLGQKGWWLPWSLDIACYCLPFFHLGRIFREQNLISRITAWYISYFVLTTIWVYYIYTGSADITSRSFGDYGITFIGSIAGILTIFLLAAFIKNNLPITASILTYSGRETLGPLLVINSTLAPLVNRFLSLRFNMKNMPFMIFSIALQLLLAVIFKMIVKTCSRLLRCVCEAP